LLTQHPRKIVGLDGYGVEIVEQIEIPRTPPTPGPDATA
jgi:GTP cyclohydrolase II